MSISESREMGRNNQRKLVPHMIFFHTMKGLMDSNQHLNCVQKSMGAVHGAVI